MHLSQSYLPYRFPPDSEEEYMPAPKRRQAQKMTKPKPARPFLGAGDMTRSGRSKTKPTNFNPKTGEPTRRIFKTARKAASLQSQLIVPARAWEKTVGRALRKKAVRRKIK